MATETAERRAVMRAQPMGAPLPPVEQQDPLPCPRCTSTNTKFCYYNNYNFSQPRHFCKACRRYWTHGGTLRDIPVGGGSRKTAKRSRTTSAASPGVSTVAAVAATTSTSSGYVVSTLEQTIPATTQQAPVLVSLPLNGGGGGFTSLLSGGDGGGGILSLGGLGLDDVGYGLAARGLWAFPNHHDIGLYVNAGGGGVGPDNGGRITGRSDTWQMESGEVVGFVGAADCFTTNPTPLPELAMSTSGNGFK